MHPILPLLLVDGVPFDKVSSGPSPLTSAYSTKVYTVRRIYIYIYKYLDACPNTFRYQDTM